MTNCYTDMIFPFKLLNPVWS